MCFGDYIAIVKIGGIVVNLGENKKTVEITTAGMNPNEFIVQGIYDITCVKCG